MTTTSTSTRHNSAKTSAKEPLAASDREVRAALVGSYDRLRNYLQRRLGTQADAEEVLQAFVVRALERSADIRAADSVRGWLSRVLATTIADFHRRTSKSKTREVPLAAELSDRLAADNPGIDLQIVVCECVYEHLPSLKTEHAEVIRRIDLAGEAREEVASELGVTVNNLTVRLHRARQALKDRLEAKCVTCSEDTFLKCACDQRPGKRTG